LSVQPVLNGKCLSIVVDHSTKSS